MKRRTRILVSWGLAVLGFGMIAGVYLFMDYALQQSDNAAMLLFVPPYALALHGGFWGGIACFLIGVVRIIAVSFERKAPAA